MRYFSFLTIIFLMHLSGTVRSQGTDFTDVTANQFTDLPQVRLGAMAWGDYDSDGRMDVIITGSGPDGDQCRLYHNTEQGFIDETTKLPDLPLVSYGAMAWGDYDNDGKLDLVYTGVNSSMLVTILYHNTGNGFENKSDLLPDLPGITTGSVAWTDYDNDGMLDLMLTGATLGGTSGLQVIGILYRNTGTGFIDVSTLLPQGHGVYYSSVAWGDYDNDGRPDLILSGNSGESIISKLFHNTINGFIDESVLLPDLPQNASGTVAWGDYDNDGLLDLIVTGVSLSLGVTKLYHNTGSGFEDKSSLLADLQNQFFYSAAWSDYDNDGLLDLILTSLQDFGGVSKLYHNTANGFEDMSALLPDISTLADNLIAWVDFDNDGKLDLMAIGGLNSAPISKLYRNQTLVANTLPAAPDGLTSIANFDGKSVQLNWNFSIDNQTPQLGLSYNLYISTTPGGQNIMSPMADLTTGLRRIAQLGSKQINAFVIANLAPSTTYYWSVQAIDGAFAGSPFATEGTFKTESGLPVHLINFSVKEQEKNIELNWQTAGETNSASFEIQRSRNAKNWIAVGVVAATGESNTTRDYLFYDKNPFFGINYYRLKMIDLDESYAFSTIRDVNIWNQNVVFVYPNPVSDRLYLTSPDLAKIEFARITNGLGQEVYYSKKVTKEGIAINNLAAGSYIVQVKKEDGSMQFQQVVVVR